MPVSHDAIARVQMRNRAKLYSYIWSIVHDEHVAEDVMQDVYALALKKCDEIDDEEHLLNWTRKAARLTALRALRERHKSPVFLSDTTLDLLEQDWADMDSEDPSTMIEALRKCMGFLTPRAKQMVKMRYVDGIRCTDMAKTLNHKVESVYVAMSRIHRTLSNCIRSRIMREGVSDGE